MAKSANEKWTEYVDDLDIRDKQLEQADIIIEECRKYIFPKWKLGSKLKEALEKWDELNGTSTN